MYLKKALKILEGNQVLKDRFQDTEYGKYTDREYPELKKIGIKLLKGNITPEQVISVNWISEAKFKNMVAEYDGSTGGFNFSDGTWIDGVFRGDNMLNCTWKDGEFKGNQFYNGTWEDGVFGSRNGSISSSIFKSKWLKGNYYGVEAEDCTFKEVYVYGRGIMKECTFNYIKRDSRDKTKYIASYVIDGNKAYKMSRDGSINMYDY